MKPIKYLLLILFATMIAEQSQGQVKITGFGGYNIQDRVHGYNGDVVIAGGGYYGGMLSYQKSNQLSIDLTYLQQQTSFKVTNFYLPANSGSIKGTVNYIMLGVSHSPDFSAKIAPYGGLMLGTAGFAPKEKFSDEWKFAVGGKLGVIAHVSEKVGIVIQSQLLVPVQSVGLGVGCGTGGCGGGAGTSSTATQLGFTGGVEIKLN